jgi:hypothetical protein
LVRDVVISDIAWVCIYKQFAASVVGRTKTAVVQHLRLPFVQCAVDPVAKRAVLERYLLPYITYCGLSYMALDGCVCLQNMRFSSSELNELVQKLLDLLVFVRSEPQRKGVPIIWWTRVFGSNGDDTVLRRN